MKRRVAVVVAVIVAANLVVWAVDRVAPGPGGHASSSLATAPRGFAAWAELARRDGVRVLAEREPLDRAELPRGATVVVLDAPDLPRREAVAVRDHLRAGGRAVLGGRGARSWIGAATRGAPAARVRRVGSTASLQNRNLAHGDNALRALRLSRPGPLVFAEAAHGYGPATGLAALPASAKWALGLLGLAALTLLASAGRRFGPPEADARELAPPRAAYVDALARRLERAEARR